jgi:hypothetical protein
MPVLQTLQAALQLSQLQSPDLAWILTHGMHCRRDVITATMVFVLGRIVGFAIVATMVLCNAVFAASTKNLSTATVLPYKANVLNSTDTLL